MPGVKDWRIMQAVARNPVAGHQPATRQVQDTKPSRAKTNIPPASQLAPFPLLPPPPQKKRKQVQLK